MSHEITSDSAKTRKERRRNEIRIGTARARSPVARSSALRIRRSVAALALLLLCGDMNDANEEDTVIALERSGLRQLEVLHQCTESLKLSRTMEDHGKEPIGHAGRVGQKEKQHSIRSESVGCTGSLAMRMLPMSSPSFCETC